MTIGSVNDNDNISFPKFIFYIIPSPCIFPNVPILSKIQSRQTDAHAYTPCRKKLLYVEIAH